MKKLLICLIVIFASAAHGQVQLPQSPAEQALAQKLMDEINSNLGLRARVIELQHKLEQQEKPETKNEPSADEKAKRELEEKNRLAHPPGAWNTHEDKK